MPTSDSGPITRDERRDAFEQQRFKSLVESQKLDEAIVQAGSVSGIESLVRMLEASRTQLAGEHRLLREEAHAAVQRLVLAGFATAQLEHARAELLELRRRMAMLRRRLQHLQRRLKSAYASAGKAADANLAKQLGAQLERLKKLEPGMSRALLALQTIEQAYGTFADGSAPVLRVHVGDQASEQLGRALVAVVPGAAIAQTALSLLREGADTVPPAAPASPAGADDAAKPRALDGLRAFTHALGAK